MTRVYLSIGSNIEREFNIRSSVSQLQELFAPLTLSSVYQSKAVGFQGSDFYNFALGFDTAASLSHIQSALRGIEAAHGRRRGTNKYSSRPLDIDLLLFGDLVRHSDDIDIPRHEIMQYAFVLLPLSEIAADVVHPETAQTIGQMWRDFAASDQTIKKLDFRFFNSDT